MRKKIAKGLLRQRDPQGRRRLMLIYAVAFLVLFAATGYFSNLTSPLKVIPQTMTAIGMGYVMLFISSLRQFKHVAEFIDWAKVTEVTETPKATDKTPDATAA